jgi:hypothetical protein
MSLVWLLCGWACGPSLVTVTELALLYSMCASPHTHVGYTITNTSLNLLSRSTVGSSHRLAAADSCALSYDKLVKRIADKLVPRKPPASCRTGNSVLYMLVM